MNRLFPDDPGRPHRPKRVPGEPPESHFERLQAAVYYAQMMLDPPPGLARDEEALRDYQANADERQCSLLAAMVLHFVSPLDGPDYMVHLAEGRMPPTLMLAREGRSVTHAYVCLATPRGDLIQAGPMERDAGGEWIYRIEEQSDPRLEDAVAFVLALGAPAPNA